jgi:DNA-directed RNA polymerase
VCWTVSGKHLHPSGIAQLLFAIKLTTSLPEVDTRHVCFPYLMDASGTGCGCNGTMRALHGTPAQQRSSQGRRACTRLHIDISESTEGWSKT